MPDWDDSDRKGSDEDAAWRDLVARFDAPARVDQPSPWPDREDPDRQEPDRQEPDRQEPDRQEPDREPVNRDDPDQDSADRSESDKDTAPVTLFQTGTSTMGTPTVSSWRTSGQPATNPEDEHFIPPTPPPLPQLQPLTKAAWLALFGGPAYLLIATSLGWSMPGVAVFCAIAAFVGGVALLVLRLNDSSSHDDDNDDGAVVLLGVKTTPPDPPPATLLAVTDSPGREAASGPPQPGDPAKLAPLAAGPPQSAAAGVAVKEARGLPSLAAAERFSAGEVGGPDKTGVGT